MSKPSVEEYEKAKAAIPILRDAMRMSTEKIFKIMDVLADERKRYDEYRNLIDHNNKVILTYETYEEMQKK